MYIWYLGCSIVEASQSRRDCFYNVTGSTANYSEIGWYASVQLKRYPEALGNAHNTRRLLTILYRLHVPTLIYPPTKIVYRCITWNLSCSVVKCTSLSSSKIYNRIYFWWWTLILPNVFKTQVLLIYMYIQYICIIDIYNAIGAPTAVSVANYECQYVKI